MLLKGLHMFAAVALVPSPIRLSASPSYVLFLTSSLSPSRFLLLPTTEIAEDALRSEPSPHR